jgi:alpha-aminoadipic semialdehyde synthase
MSKTVGLPVAISSEMILNGEFNQRGVVRPLMKELYTPVLKKLKQHGIHFEERQIK